MSARWRRMHDIRRTTPADAHAPAYPADGGRVEPSDRDARALEDLLDDMRELRLTLAADLAAVAGAVEAGADDVAGEIVVADQGDIAGFLRRSRERLQALDAVASATTAADADPVPVQRAWRRRALVALPAVPLVGALAVTAAAAAGLLPGLPSAPRPVQVNALPASTAPGAPVATTFHRFETVLESDPSASQVVAAATALHKQLAQMIATSSQDPAHVTEVAKLLQLEQALLMRTRAPGTATVLAASRKLAQQLVADASSYPTTRSTPAYVQPSHPSSHPSTAPRPKPTPTSTTAPAPAPTTTSSPSTTPKPTTSSTPAPSSSSTPHLPTIGG